MRRQLDCNGLAVMEAQHVRKFVVFSYDSWLLYF